MAGTRGRPAFITSFVGRSAELLKVQELVQSGRLVTLAGPGGMGKTRLAYRLLGELEPEYPDRVWAVELADLADPALLVGTVAASVGAPPVSSEGAAAAVGAFIGDDPAVLYLDNCEHLVDACAELVSELLRLCPQLHVLTSSRQGLRLLGEQIYAVPPLNAADGLELFTARAQLAMPDWVPDERARLTAGKVCATLDGWPLSIELAASQVRMFSPDVLLDRLHDQFGALGSVRGEPARKSSLEACVQWSYDLCTEAERTVWQRLSVFAGHFSLDAVREACSSPSLSGDAVVAALMGLIDKSVVARDAEGPTGRYVMLEGIRQFGLACLARDGALEDAKRRHRDYYLALAERFEREWLGPDQVAWMKQLGRERANLRLALEFAVSSVLEAATAMRMSPVIEHFFASTGGVAEGIRWLTRALAYPAGTNHERAAALRVGAFIASISADLATADAMVAQLRELADGTGDSLIRALMLYGDSVRLAFSGDATAGAAVAAEGVQLLAQLGETWLEANLQFLRGMTLGWADRPDEAALAYRGCFEVTAPYGERWLTSYSQWGMGLDALLRGDVPAAIDLERSALRAKADFDDQLGIGLTLEVLAWAAAEQRRGPDASVLLGAAQAIWDKIGMSVAGMPYISRRREAGIAAARRLLEVREFEVLHAQGANMLQEDVVAIALGDRGLPVKDVPKLSRREREIAELVARGDSNRRIAEDLFLSVRTVESHVESILRKLGVESRGQVAEALRN